MGECKAITFIVEVQIAFMLILIEERTSEQLIFATQKVHCYIHIEFRTYT